MITTRTAFVLGAGCSQPYGYPLGRDLRNEIIELLGKESEVVMKVLLEFHSFREIKEFREALSFSGKASVDAFLEHRPDLLDIGKRAIAATLIPYEVHNHLFVPEDHWYERLFQKMNAPFEKFKENQVAFITFNYDRSLEHYLFTALQHSYNRTNEEVAEQLSAITIIHPHGRLGSLPWQTKIAARDYRPLLTKDMVDIASSGIRIIHEDSDAEAFQSAQSTLAWAEQIFFLGFAYDPTSVRRLKVTSLGSPKHGSCYDMTDLECYAARNMIRGLELCDNQTDAVRFMRNHVP